MPFICMDERKKRTGVYTNLDELTYILHTTTDVSAAQQNSTEDAFKQHVLGVIDVFDEINQRSDYETL